MTSIVRIKPRQENQCSNEGLGKGAPHQQCVAISERHPNTMNRRRTGYTSRMYCLERAAAPWGQRKSCGASGQRVEMFITPAQVKRRRLSDGHVANFKLTQIQLSSALDDANV
jgi:hypothetical protein